MPECTPACRGANAGAPGLGCICGNNPDPEPPPLGIGGAILLGLAFTGTLILVTYALIEHFTK